MQASGQDRERSCLPSQPGRISPVLSCHLTQQMRLSALPLTCASCIQSLLVTHTPHTLVRPPSSLVWMLQCLFPGLHAPHPPFSISNQRKCKTERQLLPSVKLSHGFLPCLESNPNTFQAPSPQSGTCSALRSPLITGTQSLPATGPLHWPGTLFSHIFPWQAPPLCVLQVLCVIGALLNSYDIFQRRLTCPDQPLNTIH